MPDPNIVNPGDSSYSIPSPTTVPAADIPTMPLDRTLPRQVSTGDTRGTQTNTGENIVRDPHTNNTVINNSGYSQNQTINDPNTEQPVIITGKQADNTFAQRFTDENGVAIAQFGRFPDGTTALKVAKPGYDVTTATNSQLIFNSSQNIFKILATNTVTINGGTITTGVSGLQQTFDYGGPVIAHGLRFTPIIFAFGTSANGGFYATWPGNPGAWQAATCTVFDGSSISADDTYVYIDYQVHTLSIGAGNSIIPNVTVKYYLLQESAN